MRTAEDIIFAVWRNGAGAHALVRRRAAFVAMLALFWVAACTGANRPNMLDWRAHSTAEEVGFSAESLEQARLLAREGGSAAIVAVYRGNILAAWGAIDRPFMAHSIRKSLAGALYGIAVGEGVLSLDASLAELGLDDTPPLTATERSARFGELLSSRSGVFHSAAYADQEQHRSRPPRGRHAPGAFFFYNNWDFNAAETIYQRATREGLYAAFAARIAQPLGMQDFDPVHQLVVREPSQSRIPAHTFRISARDLARFGQLYLQQGRWNGRQIVPESWIASSWLSRSETGGGQGYGYLWWIYEPGSLPPHLAHLNRFHTYLARGTGGQALFVIPDAQLVVAHMADTDNGRAVAGAEVWRVVEQILAARQGTASNAPNLAPVHRRPLAEAAPPPLRPRVIALRASQLERFVGEYVRESGAPLRVYRYEDGLFLIVPEAGEAELFPVGPAEFVIQVAPGASARFTEVEAGVLQLTITADGQTIVGQREGT